MNQEIKPNGATKYKNKRPYCQLIESMHYMTAVIILSFLCNAVGHQVANV